MRSKNLEKITYVTAELFGKAYTEVTSVAKGIEGFRATGIEHFNRFIFSDEDSLPEILLSSRQRPSTTSPPLPILLSGILPILKPQTKLYDIKKKSSIK